MSHSAQSAVPSELQNQKVGEGHYQEMARAQLLIEQQDREVGFRVNAYKESDDLKDIIHQLRMENAYLKGRCAHLPADAASTRQPSQGEPRKQKHSREAARPTDEVSDQRICRQEAVVGIREDDRAFLALKLDDGYEDTYEGYKAIIKAIADSRNEYVDMYEQACHDRQNTFETYVQRKQNQQVRVEKYFAKKEEAYLKRIQSYGRKTTRHTTQIATFKDDLANCNGKNEIHTAEKSALEDKVKELTDRCERRHRMDTIFAKRPGVIGRDKKTSDLVDKRLAVMQRELSSEQLENVNNFIQQGHPATEYRPMAPQLTVASGSRNRVTLYRREFYPQAQPEAQDIRKKPPPPSDLQE